MKSSPSQFLQLGFLIENRPSTHALLQAARAGMYFLILLVSIGIYVTQPLFINWGLLFPFYSLLILGFLTQICWLSISEKLHRFSKVYFAGFVLDSILLSALIHFSGLNQSLFLFLQLVNILIAGLYFHIRGSLLVAFVTSASFAIATVFSPEMKPLQLVFMLALNNIAFFVVAYIAGFLSEQVNTVGTELKETGLSLQEQKDFNSALIENLPLGVVSRDEQGQVLQINPKLLDILKVQPEQEKQIPTLYPELFKSPEVSKGRSEITVVRGDERKTFGVLNSQFFSPVLEQEVELRLIEDLTLIKQLENNLKQSEKLAAVGGLAAGIAHEIRNPLAGISGSIELLSQTTQNEDDKKLMKIILREIDRLNNLIGEFLEYSRPEQPPQQIINLVPVLQEVIDNIRSNKNLRSDIKVVVDMPEHAPIWGKPDKLKQAFLNIILNAFQAMQDSTTPEFKLSLAVHGKTIVLRLKDNGCGMSEETKRRMFEPFHTTKVKGTGLGLAVTHKILDGHKVQLNVESELGIGTEFVLEFPLGQN
ncbi:MAG: ATP-binding protein [Bdellovibrionia bacterium]